MNLNASGPGSLKAALDGTEPRKIIFNVAGTIWLTNDLVISNPHVIIAGETAPSAGITIAGAGIRIETWNVEIRELKIRVGDLPDGPTPEGRMGIFIGASDNTNVHQVLIDHCSVSWAIDENITLWHPGVRDVIVRRCLIAEGLSNSDHPKGEHSCGLLLGDHAKRILIQGNLFVHDNRRNPLYKGDTISAIVNNYIYNNPRYGIHTLDVENSGPVKASLMGNVIRLGLDCDPERILRDILVDDTTKDGSQIYLDDNDVQYITDETEGFDPFVDTPPWLPNGLTVIPSTDIFDWLVENAGARRWNRDAHDRRIIDDVLNGTGHLIDSQDEVGGWL